MKIIKNNIDKDLRTWGIIFKILNKTFTERRLRLFSQFTFRLPINDPMVTFTETFIPRKDGSMLRIGLFKSRNPEEEIPGVLWLHGGGYALGFPEQIKNRAKQLIAASNCVVIAPDYRLSPEAPYPAALEDGYTALLWMKNNAEALGIRDNQLMVGGDSAGGGLTAGLSLYARDKGEVAIAFQMPLYPMLDDRMKSESARDNDAPVWNSESNFNAWKLYLGELFGSPDVPPYAAPARAKDFSNLPPTLTYVGALEPFRDETVQYVENLRKANIPVDFDIYPGCYHAFDQVCPNAKISQKAIKFLMSSFTYAVEHYFAEQIINAFSKR